MHTLIAFATQWGSKYGGINSFNTDFLSAFGFAYNLNAQIFCIVANATPEEHEEAKRVHVKLIPLPYDAKEKTFTQAHGEAGIQVIKNQNIGFDPEKTICLGHDRITGAAACAAAKIAGGRSALIHHMSYDHYESYAEKSLLADEKKREQAALFGEADIVLAVGPLLRDAAEDLINGSKTVHMLIPGLAEIDPKNTPKTFSAFLSGRLSDDASRIKQGYLGVAAFAQAQNEARENGMPEGLCLQPKLVLRGVDFETSIIKSPLQSDTERELKKFAEKYADGVINLHALPFTQDRKTLYDDLSKASVALMPSWHEGFGLVAWEAVAAGVPLILSKNSGVYKLLNEKLPGAGPGCVNVIDVRASIDEPFFHDADLKSVVAAIKSVANNPAEARKKAGILRGLLSEYTWSSCAEEAVKCFGWSLPKGSITIISPANAEQSSSNLTPSTETSPATAANDSPLQIPKKFWRSGVGIAVSQLLRAEETIVQFDTARQPEVDALNAWLDDSRWPQAIRLVTGSGGSGKTRLALELCQKRQDMGWHTGFLDVALADNDMISNWQKLINFEQPLLIVVDYAETRQSSLIALIKAMIDSPNNKPVRFLLLARDGGEWWDNLPGKDQKSEPLLSGYATSGPFHLLPLYSTIQDRQKAYQQALNAYAEALGIAAPDIYPLLEGDHFDYPLYVQMAALLALYGEQPTSESGLTKALLNHERRYWRGLLANYRWASQEWDAQLLLAVTTLAGGFETSRDAQGYWNKANSNLTASDFRILFKALLRLYPGKRGLQTVRPDLLGEALVAQTLLNSESWDILDEVLSNNSKSYIRCHALTIIARISVQRQDLRGILVEALVRNFAHCCQELIDVAIETPGLSSLAEEAFTRLPLNTKSQVVGQIEPLLPEESVQLAALKCLVSEFLVEKSRIKLRQKQNNTDRMYNYAMELTNHAINLSNYGENQKAFSCSEKAVQIFGRLYLIDKQSFAPAYATSLSNYANILSDVGKYDDALKNAKVSLDIRNRLAQRNPDLYEPDYATSLSNYANRLSDVDRYDDALKHTEEALKIRHRLKEKNLLYEPDYATSLISVHPETPVFKEMLC